MTIRISPAQAEDIDSCVEVLFTTNLGKKYYPTEAVAQSQIAKGIEENSFYFANYGEKCVGYVWFQLKGAFFMYPYLHQIVVRHNLQGRGYGKVLLAFYEQQALHNDGSVRLRTKSFLTVESSNEMAIRMYTNFNYKKVGEIPGLFRKNCQEQLMMKELFAPV